MKRITAIDFVNYKAFYQNGIENRIEIPNGKSVLIYGENGSGKSSIYEGLKQFFNSSDNTIEVIPSRHIAVPKTRTENAGTENETEVSNEVSVKITFSDNDGSEDRVFGIPTSNVQGTNYIAQANLLNGFLSYRELLRTYLMDNPKNREEFRLKFAQLLIEVILPKQRNTASQQTFQKSWDNLFTPRSWYKEENLEQFSTGLKYEIHRINLLLPAILRYFESDFFVQLILVRSEIEKYHSQKMNRWGKYPICEVDLNVKLFGNNADNDEENHLTVLNEARLSALAISIYLASLINTPQDNFNLKLLFLDDIFIGLDMSNRLPLLEILKSFRKPIIEQFIDAEHDNAIVERVNEVDGVQQTEVEPFFKNYQIFISTYDRFWFEVAKREFESKSQGKWHYIEMYANKNENLNFTTPLFFTSQNYIQRANYYYHNHDYPSCANHLRKALEERLKVLLPAYKHYAEYPDPETGNLEIKRLKSLNQYLEKFITYCDENGIDASELTDLKNLKDWYFNPFSHDNIGTPIFKRELDIAKKLVESLGNFEFSMLLPAETLLYFSFNNGSGKNWKFKIELQENLRWIKSVDGNILTNPKIHCYEKSIDGTISTVNWSMSGETPWSLMKFFANRWHKFIENDSPVNMGRYWNEIFKSNDNQSLADIIVLHE